MSEKNMALLSQEEIDTLIRFLTKEKLNFNSDVLNQESIDKLIALIRANQKENHKFHINVPIDNIDTEQIIDFFSRLDDTHEENSTYELIFKINEETEYLELYGKNTISENLIKISPNTLENIETTEDTPWGFSVMPLLFNRIASALHMKYSQKTLDSICELYALKNYGSINAVIPEVFLPEDLEVFRNLLV